MAIHFQCPVCNATMTVPDNEGGSKRDCPQCGQRLQVPQPARRTLASKLVDAAARRRPAPVVAPLAQRAPVVPCPHCRRMLAVRPVHVGQVLRCVHCGGTAQLSDTPAGIALRPVAPFGDLPATGLPVAGSSDWSVELEEDSPGRAPPVRHNGGNGAGIAGLALGCVAASVVLTGYIILCGLCGYLAIPLGVAGLVTSCFGRGGVRVVGIGVSLLSLVLALLAVVVIAEHWNQLWSLWG